MRSNLIDNSGKLSIALMVEARLHWQSGTTTRSEKTLHINSKGVGLQRDNDTEPERMTHQEAANLVWVIQDQDSTIQESKLKKYRELRWKSIAASVQKLVNTNR
ncbi:hypothetical protein B0H10DRAFT_1955867 [Mycena sp. CBHHK59/15]|nr:hypothetical protein B0H10DRAFT_1955867 [Mycena sp. CBHHK59/15]